MNNFKTYVNYAQPVVEAINKHHNKFYLLQYCGIRPQDLCVDEENLIKFEASGEPGAFKGDIPLIYAQYGEETGASLAIELTAEHRKLLSKELAFELFGEHFDLWEDGVVYALLDHEYYQTCSGFAVHEIVDPTSGGVGNALDFISERLGLTYLNLHEGNSNLDFILDQ